MKNPHLSKSSVLTAPVTEIFHSFQGEGIYLGQPQVFVRFAGCNLRCAYCDTKYSRNAENGSPKTVQQIVEKIKNLNSRRADAAQTVSLTGGEPLLQADFLIKLLPRIKKAGYKTYLETNGTLPEEFLKIRKWVDIISMDIKLPGAIGKKICEVYSAFLGLAKGKKIFIKIVLTDKTTVNEIKKAVRLAVKINKKMPVVLQPVSAVKGVPGIKPARLYKLLVETRKIAGSAHVIPQMHKIWQIK